MLRFACLLTLLTLLSLTSVAQAEPTIDFSRDILPILSENCFYCHGPDASHREADLRLDDRTVAVESKAIVPHKPDESEMLKRILSSSDDERMPPPKSNRKLSEKEIELLKTWIASGATWGKHWAFTPPVRTPVPPVKHVDLLGNSLDAFILAKLERENLAFAPVAAKATLIRRASLDLTGLPPTTEEVARFVNDSSDLAYSQLIDRLLASPRYGERMAWDWLDAARYADTNGYQGDQTRTMWPWRDWVVSAFNRNQPFNEFTIEQLAGDLIPNATLEQKLATGFCRNHMINGEGGRIAEENRVEYIMDQVETTATIWLGATFNCCRCHDHKFDPYTRQDYYGMFDIFNRTPVNGGGGSGQTEPVIEFIESMQQVERETLQQALAYAAIVVEEHEKTIFPREEKQAISESEAAKQLDTKLISILKKIPQNRTIQDDAELLNLYKNSQPPYAAALQDLRDKRQKLEGINKSIVRVMVMKDDKPRETFILEKGQYNKPLSKVMASMPSCLNEQPAASAINRLTLAQWLVDRKHPITARVIVNRYWQQIFGVGLVKTSEDFGVQGEKPLHADLLDWLAVEYMESGWDTKHLLRLIFNSRTYQQSSQVTPQLLERDPENRLLARGARFRMPAFMLRDQALAASGLLVERWGGAGVNGYQPPGIWEEATFGNMKYTQDKGEKLYRRSLYTFWRRIIAPTMFFDTATRQTCTVKNSRTNSPLHALVTLNDVTYIEAARALAQRAMQAETEPANRIKLAFNLVLCRSCQDSELQVLQNSYTRLHKEFLADESSARQLLSAGESPRNSLLPVVDHAALTGVCMAILNLDEALTKE